MQILVCDDVQKNRPTRTNFDTFEFFAKVLRYDSNAKYITSSRTLPFLHIYTSQIVQRQKLCIRIKR